MFNKVNLVLSKNSNKDNLIKLVFIMCKMRKHDIYYGSKRVVEYSLSVPK